MNFVPWILIGVGGLLLLSLGAFGVISHREHERRSARVALIAAILGSLPLFVTSLLPAATQTILLAILGMAAAAGAILFLWPMPAAKRRRGEPTVRVDERDIMFARADLEPGTPLYEAYYARRPEHKAADDRARAMPGILSPNAAAANPFAFAPSQASFKLVEETMGQAIDGPVTETRVDGNPTQWTSYAKGLARYFGALTVGITELRPEHIYTHVGRGVEHYGEPIKLDHRYAIAFTVEMDYDQIGPAPAASVVMESGKQYAEAAFVAVQVADTIRSLGYPARAHISRNYQVIAPLVARDAGLGEIGRMGLLMTPQVGPRVRLGVVTTDLPLIIDEPHDFSSMIDFCEVCKKCAVCCPSRSIPEHERREIDGALRWRIDAEGCFSYWNHIGTDCARCMAVCPYSHPNNVMHNAVRWVIHHSPRGRRAALWLDDLFYGRKPAPRPAPAWIPGRPVQRSSG